jgi:S-formylglutathione hydrolase
MAAGAILKELKSIRTTGNGLYKRFSHVSGVIGGEMTFSVYLPPQAEKGRVPALYFLSGLTCNDLNFAEKACAFRGAAIHGLALICPDTSPRHCKHEGDDAKWDFGKGAGFYVNATQAPWNEAYHMYDYVTKELPKVVEAELPVTGHKSVFGHSMGGHGALISFLKNPGAYQSVSAFAPICHPSVVPWGDKCFGNYLGPNKADWAAYDATELIAHYNGPKKEILIDQGDADSFLEQQLRPSDFVAAANAVQHPVQLRMQPGFDHGYFFIQAFIDDHLAFHAAALK